MIIGCICLVGMPSLGAVLTTQEAHQFLEHYLPNPQQEWPKHLPTRADIPKGKQGEYIKKGIAILEHTSSLVGPRVKNPDKRISHNNLNCIQCHAAGESGLPGTRQWQLPYINVRHEYPKLDIKSMKIITLQDRIRGMFGGGNGKLSDDSEEMKAIMAYFTWLGSYTKPGASMKGSFLKEISEPKVAANPKKGKKLYEAKCQVCHGEKGLGVKKPGFEKGAGYLYPPIAGDDSYTDGGHMYLVPVMARFIYGYMPLGATLENPQLTVEEAHHIALFINSTLPRKHDPKRGSYYPNPAFRPEYLK